MASSVLPPGGDKDKMMNQANHIWQMLDDMASSDPAAYRKFIDKQMSDCKEHMKPPNPHMCVQTVIQGAGTPFFVNVFEWSRIPKPKDDSAPIPCMGGDIYQLDDSSDKTRVVSVSFNTEVIDMFGIDSNLIEERRMLINLAFDFIENQHKVKLSRSYTLLGKDAICKGEKDKAVQSLLKKYGGQTQDDLKQDIDALEHKIGPMGADCKDSLMQQLSGIGGANEQKPSGKKPADFQFHMPTEVADKKGLIEEVAMEPEYIIQNKQVDEREVLVVKVKLPGIKSVSQCDLDISKIDLHLTVEKQYELLLKLPSKIDDVAASAKFSRKSSQLTLTLPCAET